MKADIISIFIANISETYQDYLATDIAKFRFFNTLGYRAALWRGDRRIVISSLPIQNIDYLRSVMGGVQLTNLFPSDPTYSLCTDIIQDRVSLDTLLSSCAEVAAVRVVPYGTTKEFLTLADHLTDKLRRHKVDVLLPESPLSQDLLWKWKYFDSKIGSQNLLENCKNGLPNICLPEGYIARNYQDAAEIIRWFMNQRKECMCKSSIGVFGLGATRYLEADFDFSQHEILLRIKSAISSNAFPVIVEELIRAEISPSIEARVPLIGDGAVEVTYACLQNFNSNGLFDGITIGPDTLSTKVTDEITHCSVEIGGYLQSLGYVGMFDLDFVVDSINQQVYFTEANLRRTGGTHVHEAASHILGENYASNYYVANVSNFRQTKPLSWNELESRLGPYLFSMSREEGVLIAKGFYQTMSPELIYITTTRKRMMELGETIKLALQS